MRQNMTENSQDNFLVPKEWKEALKSPTDICKLEKIYRSHVKNTECRDAALEFAARELMPTVNVIQFSADDPDRSAEIETHLMTMLTGFAVFFAGSKEDKFYYECMRAMDLIRRFSVKRF
jgi:hypothetical protein